MAGECPGLAVGGASEDVCLALSRGTTQGSLSRWRAGSAHEVKLPGLSVAGSEAGAGWADFDGDGDLDLYVRRYAVPDLLAVHQGGGAFTA